MPIERMRIGGTDEKDKMENDDSENSNSNNNQHNNTNEPVEYDSNYIIKANQPPNIEEDELVNR
jgi:hypothetical protein